MAKDKSASNKERYAFLKEHGICVYCGRADAAKGRVGCLDCLEERAVKAYIRYASKSPEAREERIKSERERQKNVRQEKKLRGECSQCTKPVYKWGRCYEHYLQAKRVNSYRSNNYASQGLCKCGKETIEGKKVCSECYDRNLFNLEKAKEAKCKTKTK